MTQIWTGSGWDTPPTFNASDFGYKRSGLYAGMGADDGFHGDQGAQAYEQNWQLLNREPYGGYGGWGGLALDNPNYSLRPGGDESGFDVWLKSGDKEGTNLRYNLVNGQYVPDVDSYNKFTWNSNPTAANRGLVSVVGAGLLGAGMAAYGAGGASLAGSGSFVGGPGMTGAGIVAEGAGAAGAAGGAASAGGYSGWGGSMGVEPISYSGMQGGIGSYGAGYGLPGGVVAGEAGGGLMGAGGYMSNMGGSSFLDQLKSAYDTYKQVNQVRSGVNQVSNLLGGGQQQGGARGPGGSNMSRLDQLFNMGGSIYSANKNDNYADELRNLAAQREADRRPFIDRLQRSYDNPNEFLQGDYKPMHDIEANRLARLGARSGTNANDIDRTRLLEAHGMKALGDYRTGLQGSIDRMPNPQDLYLKAMEADRMKNTPLFAGGAYGGMGGSGAGGIGGLAGMIPGVAGAIGGAGDWLRMIGNGNWWSDGAGEQAAAEIVDWGTWTDNSSWMDDVVGWF